MMKTFSLNLDFAPMTNSDDKSGAMALSLENTRESDSAELTCDLEQSYTEAMEMMHKLTMSKQSSNSDQIDSRESKEEETDGEEQENQEDYTTQDDGEENDHCTLKTRKKISVNLMWAPKIEKKTRSRIQDFANDDEKEGNFESDGFFTLSFAIGDDADNEEEEKEKDIDDEQDDEEEEQDREEKDDENLGIQRVLVFDEWKPETESIPTPTWESHVLLVSSVFGDNYDYDTQVLMVSMVQSVWRWWLIEI